MNTPHPYDLIIGLDRSDRKADLHLIDTRTGGGSFPYGPNRIWPPLKIER